MCVVWPRGLYIYQRFSVFSSYMRWPGRAGCKVEVVGFLWLGILVTVPSASEWCFSVHHAASSHSLCLLLGLRRPPLLRHDGYAVRGGCMYALMPNGFEGECWCKHVGVYSLETSTSIARIARLSSSSTESDDSSGCFVIQTRRSGLCLYVTCGGTKGDVNQVPQVLPSYYKSACKALFTHL